jgi:chemotaxis signal transduction protein
MSDRSWSDADRAILLARSASVARAAVGEHAPAEPVVFFRVGRGKYCALARSIRGAVRLERMVPVPHGGRSVAGAIVRAGNALPVFHLAALVGDRIGRLPETAHGLLLGGATDEIALAVDDIEGFGELLATDLREPPDDVRSRWVTSATADGRLFLDLDALRASKTLWVDARQIRTE